METKDEIIKLNLCDGNCLFDTDCLSCMEIKFRLVQESEANNGSN